MLNPDFLLLAPGVCGLGCYIMTKGDRQLQGPEGGKRQQLLITPCSPEGNREHRSSVDSPLSTEKEWTKQPGKGGSPESHFESETSSESLSLGGRGDWAGLRFQAADSSTATWWPLALVHSPGAWSRQRSKQRQEVLGSHLIQTSRWFF